MRRYLALAEEGAGWLVVYAPSDESVEQPVDVAKRFNAQSARCATTASPAKT